MKTYMIELPRGVRVNLFNIPENFDAIVLKCFAGYTEGTAPAYRDTDRLGFIDIFVRKLHQREGDAEDIVYEFLKDRMYDLWEEYRRMPEKEEIYNRDTMEELCRLGQESRKLAAKYGDDHHIYDEIHRVLARVMRVVSNATEEEIKEAQHDK